MAKKVTAADKQKIMTGLLKSSAGRARIAQFMQEPLRRLRDYQSVGRRAFYIDELPDGVPAIYDKDPELPAYVVSEEGDSVQTIAKSTRITVPIFEIASNPKVPFTQVKERRFDIVRRIRQKAKDELFRKEDNIIFATMEAVSTANTTNTELATGAGNALDMEILADGFAGIEQHGLRVDKVYMNAKNYRAIRTAGRDYIVDEDQRELLRTGLIAWLWGAPIYTSPEVPVDKVFLVTEPEYFGVMPIRIDLTVLPDDNAGARVLGWSIFEAIGIAIYNDLGIQGIRIGA